MRSLKLRLSIGLLASMLVMFAILGFTVTLFIRNSLEQYVVTRLEHDAENLLGGMQVAEDGQLLIDTSRIQGIYQQPFSGHYFVIRTATDSINSRSLWDQGILPPQANTGETVVTHITGPQQQRLLLLVKGYQRNEKDIQIATAEDISHVEREIALFRTRFAAAALLTLVGLIFLQRFILQRGLRPLDKIRTEMQELELGKTDQLNEHVPDEIYPLVREINRLLDSQRKRLHRLRDALGNLAHAIKTPLALIQHLVNDPHVKIDSETQQQLQKNTARIASLLDHELKRARLAGHSLGMTRFNLGKNISDLVTTLQQLYPDKQVNFSIRGNSNINVILDQEDGMELFGNLLDNAWKWTISAVMLTITQNDSLSLQIEDDGPGCQPEKLTELTQRGARFDESTRGYGIGLSIAQAIVDNLGGKLHFKNSERLGGLKVEIILPIRHSLSGLDK